LGVNNEAVLVLLGKCKGLLIRGWSGDTSRPNSVPGLEGRFDSLFGFTALKSETGERRPVVGFSLP